MTVTDPQTGYDDVYAMCDRDLLLHVVKQLDHRDVMLHEIAQQVADLHQAFAKYAPLLDLAAAKVDAANGGPWRRWRAAPGGQHAAGS